MPYVLPVLVAVVMIAVLVDIIGSDEWRIRNLNKITWVIIVIILPFVGSVLWLAVGRTWDASPRRDLGSFGDPRRREALGFGSTEAELEAIEAEIAFHERQAEIARLEARIREKKSERGGSATV